MGKVPKIIKWIFNEKEKHSVDYPLNEEEIESSQKWRAMAQRLQSRDAELASYKAQEQEEKQKEKDFSYEQELAERLAQKKQIIDKKKFGKAYSFGSFFKRLQNRKFRNQLEIADKDDEVVFGKFGDIVGVEGGFLGITDNKGHLLSYGKNLGSIIYKPDSFQNQIRRKRILLPIDKNGNPYVDLENLEAPDIIYDEDTGQYHETREKMKLVKEMLIERDERDRKNRGYIERLETSVANLQRKIKDLERALRVFETKYDTTQTEFSKTLEKNLEYDKRFGELYAQNVNLIQTQAIKEIWSNNLESMNKRMMDKLERIGSDSKMELAKVAVQEDIEFAKAQLAETHINQIMPEQKPNQDVQIGGNHKS